MKRGRVACTDDERVEGNPKREEGGKFGEERERGSANEDEPRRSKWVKSPTS